MGDLAMSKQFGALKALIAAVAALTCGFAYAADLPLAPQYQAPIVPAVPVYNWTGIYIGANGGYGFGQSTPMSLYSDSFSAFNFNTNGWMGGLTAGAQIQSGHTVMGFEADIDWTNISGSSTGPVSFNGFQVGTATLATNLSSISTIRTRVGYAADNWLFYGTAGFAITNQTSTLTGPVGFICGTGGAGSPPCTSPTDLHLGLAAGAGVEYGITPNLSAKGEWLWVGAGAGNTLRENILRAGLNWRFGM
jgi:outer membrane immunogenic protein